MLKTWLSCLMVLPTIAILTCTNYYEDPANIIHDSSKSIAEAIMSGKETYFSSGNGDERKVKYYMIKEMPKQVDCLTIGPSLSMGIRRSNVGTDNYYNLSASALNYYDYMMEFASLDINNIQYEKIILCVDSYFFDERHATINRNPELLPYTEYMIGKLDGIDMAIPQDTSKCELMQTRIKQMFSVTYFQSAVEFIKANHSLILQEKRWGIVDDSSKDHSHYMSDGSWVYDSNYRSNTINDVLEHAKNYDIQLQFGYDRHINDDCKEHFRLLVQYLIDRNVIVEFYLNPICPALWDRIQSEKDHYSMLDEIEEYAHTIANDYGIKVIGSYNPYIIGISNSDYLDSRHIRHEQLDTYFDFSQ